ncbi:MAG TPA: alanine racemase [Blastocatellia bacterium]|nr:alanine racemase [Blastocatellia bacterium]
MDDNTDSVTVSGQRPTWAEINLDNLIHNFRVMKAAVGEGVAIMPALKADAYGHGAVACAQALAHAGAEWFGVALPEEGIKLRETGIKQSILCLGGFWEGQEELIIAENLTPAIFRLDLLERLDHAARAAGIIANYHLKVDTGMGRLGVPFRELADFLDGAAQFNNVRLDGVMSHFASADLAEGDEFTQQQMDLFEEAVRMARARGHKPTWIHQANSAGAHAYPRSRGNLVRLGGVVYGIWRDSTNPESPPLDWQPVMSLHTKIVLLKTVPAGAPLGYSGTFITSRESRIATLPIGYADGARRALSNCGQVIVRGQLAPIVGRVSMDLTIVDVTDIPGASIGDEVVIIGRQGESEITAEAVAAQIGTLSYEITCGISGRVPRIYTGGNEPIGKGKF